MAADLSVIVNEHIGVWKEQTYQFLEEMTAWVNSLITPTEDHLNRSRKVCEICGSIGELENHHIAGRKHDPRTISVCLDCHQSLSKKQKLWDKRWEKKDQPEGVRQAFFLLGLKDLLDLKARKTGNSSYAELASKYTETISELLRE